MRVAVVTHYFPTSANPWAGHSAYQTLRVLAETCDIHVFYPESVYPGSFRPPGRRGEDLDRGWRPGEVDVSYIPYPALPVVTRPLNGFTIANRLLPHVRGWRPDIILNYVVYPNGYAACRIARALGVPVVLTAIGSDLNRIADPLCRVFTRAALRQADFVTTVSQDLCDTARRLGASSTLSKAILNGCDTDIFHPSDRVEARGELGLDSQAEIVLYVGRLDLRKGLVELIQSVAEMRMRRPRLHCYIVGDGPAKPRLLEEMAAVDGLSRHITFVPSLVTEKIAVWMAAADLVTLPSYNEGCPNVVIEALSAGRPVAATRVGGIPELMDETCGRLVAPRDVPALAEALDQTLSHSWDPGGISAKYGRSWDEVAADLYRVLDRTLQGYKSGN